MPLWPSSRSCVWIFISFNPRGKGEEEGGGLSIKTWLFIVPSRHKSDLISASLLV